MTRKEAQQKVDALHEHLVQLQIQIKIANRDLEFIDWQQRHDGISANMEIDYEPPSIWKENNNERK